MRYFQDDDHMGLKEMVRREKMSSAQDQNALYSRMAAKVKSLKKELAIILSKPHKKTFM